MLAELPEPSREHPDPREEYVDGPLRVHTWPTVGDTPRPRPVDIPAGAPDWWQGDEEASGSFLRAMNIDPRTMRSR